MIRDRLRDIFPDIKIPLEYIGWHLRRSTSVETICDNFVAEILASGQVKDPTINQPETTTTDSVLISLYDVFNTIPREHIELVYNRFKQTKNPNWYDDIVNELLTHPTLQTPNKKRSIEMTTTTFDDEMDGNWDPNEYQRILAILPDIDPDFAWESYTKYLERTSDTTNNDFNQFIGSLIEQGYTKITNKIERLKNEQLKENLRNPKFDIEEFLKTFPNPLVYFYDQTKTHSESYQNHAFIYLANAFARISPDHIREKLKQNNFRFAPSLKQLQEEFFTYHSNLRKKKDQNREKQVLDFMQQHLLRRARAPMTIPDVPDEIFYKELCYTKHEDEIIEYLTKKQAFRDDQIRIAKENGTLLTCDCCCDEEILDDEMIECTNQHKFCQTCVRNYVENGFILNGQCFFTCLNPNCQYEYSAALIGRLLPPTLFSRLLTKIQQEELRRANIPNFEQCKFCTFGTIIDDPNERVFRCLNQECLKETCRTCGEPNHIPLRCDEVEKKDELDMRTFIENRVSEAMIRVCHQCKQRFYKTEGCNKMTCACGASMCYVCREPINGYEHFNNNDRCGAHTDVIQMHQEEMARAYEEAKRAYIERHPDARDLVMKYDPQQHLTMKNQLVPTPKRRRRR